MLSPHADDAALSLGGCLLALALPQPVTIVTIFGESNFMFGAFHGDVPAVSKRRREEDEAFASTAGVGLLSWPYAEASLRPLSATSHGGLFAGDCDQPNVAPAGLAERLSRLLTDSPPELLLSPLGLGRHRDHLLVQQLASRLAAHHQVAIAYYEDLPYAAAQSFRSIQAWARNIDASLTPWAVSIVAELAAKVSGLAHYSSQIGAAEVQRVVNHAFGRSWLERVRSFRLRGAVQYPIERVWNRDYVLPGRFLECSYF